MEDTYLEYIGNGSFLPDTPARNLTKEEAEYYGVGRLLDSRLYKRVVKSQTHEKEEPEKFIPEDKKKRGKQ